MYLAFSVDLDSSSLHGESKDLADNILFPLPLDGESALQFMSKFHIFLPLLPKSLSADEFFGDMNLPESLKENCVLNKPLTQNIFFPLLDGPLLDSQTPGDGNPTSPFPDLGPQHSSYSGTVVNSKGIVNCDFHPLNICLSSSPLDEDPSHIAWEPSPPHLEGSEKLLITTYVGVPKFRAYDAQSIPIASIRFHNVTSHKKQKNVVIERSEKSKWVNPKVSSIMSVASALSFDSTISEYDKALREGMPQ